MPDRRGEVARAGRLGEDGESRVPRDEDADGPRKGTHGERRGEAAEERRVPEALTGPEDVHHLALVDELDRAFADDEQVLGGRPVLQQDRLAVLVAALRGHRCDRLAAGRVEGLERGEAAEERGAGRCVHALHYSTPIPVIPAPCNKSRVLPAWPHLGDPLPRRRGCRRTSRSSTTRAVG